MRALPDSIPAVNQSARDQGMSYGRFVASRQALLGKRPTNGSRPAKALKGEISPEEAARRKAFGQQLAAARESLGLSRRKLAQLLGIAPPSVERWEKAQAWPKEKSLQKLRRFFGEEVKEL